MHNNVHKGLVETAPLIAEIDAIAARGGAYDWKALSTLHAVLSSGTHLTQRGAAFIKKKIAKALEPEPQTPERY